MVLQGFSFSCARSLDQNVVMYRKHTFRSSKAWLRIRWNSSGAGLTPNGRRHHRNLPKGELKVVNIELSSVSSTCQNLFLTSTVENTLALPSFGSISSIVGVGWWLLFNALFRYLGSRHTRSCPLGFRAVTRLETQGVGSVTFLIIPRR